MIKEKKKESFIVFDIGANKGDYTQSCSDILNELKVDYRIFSQFDPKTIQKKTCQLTTIDQFMADQKIEHIDFLKIDVEGYEVDVLQGAKNALKTKKLVRSNLSMVAHI